MDIRRAPAGRGEVARCIREGQGTLASKAHGQNDTVAVSVSFVCPSQTDSARARDIRKLAMCQSRSRIGLLD